LVGFCSDFSFPNFVEVWIGLVWIFKLIYRIRFGV